MCAGESATSVGIQNSPRRKGASSRPFRVMVQGRGGEVWQWSSGAGRGLQAARAEEKARKKHEQEGPDPGHRKEHHGTVDATLTPLRPGLPGSRRAWPSAGGGQQCRAGLRSGGGPRTWACGAATGIVAWT